MTEYEVMDPCDTVSVPRRSSMQREEEDVAAPRKPPRSLPRSCASAPESRSVKAEARRSREAAKAVDCGIVGFGISVAAGSAAFAIGMILREPSPHPSFVQPRAPAAAAHRTAKDAGAIRDENVDDDRTGSIMASSADAAAQQIQARRLIQDQLGRIESPDRAISSYVIRYADDGAALVQGPAGTLVVMAGSVVSDVGLIRSIEKRAGRWVVVTATGTIEGPDAE